ncbi:MAG: sugar phosphate isomerase/epimerase [Anaerolineae bacterium]|nr:sugar phosphate isomerase/epimerase [Anaerolineae bacterium]MBN8619804.1 sugar phosphate isomerase/epimerase [Anaerolineae bacterium]
MKFGVNAWVWVSPCDTEALKKLAPTVKQMGFDMIEVPLEGIGDLDYKTGAQIIKDSGLGVSTCAAMGPDRDLIHSDPAIRENGLNYIRQAIDATHLLGGTNLVGPIYSAVGRVWQQSADDRAKDVDLLVTNLSTLARYAADKGVVLGIEPLNRFETSFLNLADQAIEVIDRVDSPACQIMLDTFHMNIEEKSLGAAIRKTGKRLAHFHACENDRGAPGSGNVAWGEVAQALRDIHYDGPVVIESFTDKVKSIARAAAIWRSFERSQDALAQNGGEFLRRLLAG